jgi:mannose-6-phosphate isomerase-like protein (cupin superfamily)
MASAMTLARTTGGIPMAGFSTNIEADTLENSDFRRVIYTASHMQLVLMALQVGEDIGQERHDDVDQFIRVESGEADAILNGETHKLTDGSVVVIPAGTEHNVINTSSTQPLRLYTIYSPPNHPDGTVNRDKKAAEEYEKYHHG